MPGVQEGDDVSEKEQADAVKLLTEWLRASANVAGGHATAADQNKLRELRERTEKFLTLPLVPESHGQRRS